MARLLSLAFRFLQPTFHGRRDRHEPEWPPSPLRAFQALVAAACCPSRAHLLPPRRAALSWLEGLSAPTVVAPRVHVGNPFRIAVPNNDMDLVMAAHAHGREPDRQPSELRTLKTIRTTWLRDEAVPVQYLWPLSEDPSASAHVSTLVNLAREVVALGWGTDLVAGTGAVLSTDEADALGGERWLPRQTPGPGGLRVPVQGTLADLDRRHSGFEGRLSDGYAAPPPLSKFTTVQYRRALDAPSWQAAAFSLLRADGEGFRSFDTARQALRVAGMLRHAASGAAIAAGWPDERVRSFVLGHGEARGATAHVTVGSRRFAYLPLPTIEARGDGDGVVSGVRRALVACFSDGCSDEIEWARRNLAGAELVDEAIGAPTAVLGSVSGSDGVLRRYLDPSPTWVTVTPVVLPGHDDPRHHRRRLRSGPPAAEQRELLGRLAVRTEALLRKAIVQAGFSGTLAEHAEVEWRTSGFLAGTDLVQRYGVPDHARRFTRVHAKITWRDASGNVVALPGPVCLGAARFHGLGLFASVRPNT